MRRDSGLRNLRQNPFHTQPSHDQAAGSCHSLPGAILAHRPFLSHTHTPTRICRVPELFIQGCLLILKTFLEGKYQSLIMFQSLVVNHQSKCSVNKLVSPWVVGPWWGQKRPTALVQLEMVMNFLGQPHLSTRGMQAEQETAGVPHSTCPVPLWARSHRHLTLMVKLKGPGATLPKFKSWLHHAPA